MEIKKLTGGKTIGVNPDRLPVSVYADPARIRVGAPGSIVGNVALGVQLSECARKALGTPETTQAKVVFREVDGTLYLLVVPVREAGPNVYAVKYEGKSPIPVVRFLKPLFQEARITLREDIWYDMESVLVEDEEHGFAVAGVWTAAVTTPRGESEREAAPGAQPTE